MSEQELLNESDGANYQQLLERITELELAMEDADYVRLATNGDREFSRGGLAKIVKLARLMYLKNPLINRAVSVQQFYVWAQGVSFVARNKRIQEVIQAFVSDPKNEVEITGHQARMDKEADLQVEGNLFFAFFTNVSSGKVRVKTLPFDEMEDIYCNPDDGREPWFYLRRWVSSSIVDSSDYTENARWYPDINYTPRSRPAKFNNIPIAWESPVLHVKVGGMSCMKFGVSEMFAALDWSLAYKSFLEDWATITRAHARFAWNLTTTGGKQGVAAAKAKLQSTLGINSGQGTERNPPPAAGSVFISGEGQKLDPVKTAGATGSSSDGRRLLLMVAAATGWPETFFGDAAIGNLATARSLDRPTELRIKNRQTLWTAVFKRMFDYVIEQAIKASSGKLRGLAQVLRDEDDEIYVEWGDDPENKKPIDPVVNVEFPSILERDIGVTVGSIISSATLGGKPLSGMISAENTSRMLQVALGVDDVDEAVSDAMREYKAITAANLALATKQAEPAQPKPQEVEDEETEEPETEPEEEGEDKQESEDSMDSVEAAIREATEAVRKALSA